MKNTIIFLLATLCLSQIYSKVTYEGYKVYEIVLKNEREINGFDQIRKNDQVDVWSKHKLTNVPVRVMVTPKYQRTFENELETLRISYKVVIQDVQRHDEEKAKLSKNIISKPGDDISFDQYYHHSEINAYLDSLAKKYPNVVSLDTIGKSYEGRNLTAIKISSGGSGKPMIFSESGIHAREWIAPSLNLYIINQLVENPANKDLYEKVDWLILPVTNPDGYEYSRTVEQYWRKTRSPGKKCHGVDGNRNFGFHWGESGADDDECSEIFQGNEAFSEKETQAVKGAFLKYKDNIKLYFAIHSYGNLLVYPYSYEVKFPDNSDELQSVAENAAAAILAVNGSEFAIGNSAQILYPSAGCSDDYAMGSAGVPMAYTMEIADEFIPPEVSIKSIVEKNWEGFKVFHKHIADKYGNK